MASAVLREGLGKGKSKGLWSDFVELDAAKHVLPVTDTVSVLCTFERV